MIVLGGLGPGSVHFVGLITIFLIETVHLILIELLISRSIFEILNHNVYTKYIGRLLHSNNKVWVAYFNGKNVIFS